MAKTTVKTVETTGSTAAFVATITITDKQRQADCQALVEAFRKGSGFEPKMWGTTIIGFGSYHYKYESGREGDAPMAGFSPRKSEFSLYVANFEGRDELLAKLGKHKTAKACVYIKNLADINIAVLEKLVAGSVKHYRQKYR